MNKEKNHPVASRPSKKRKNTYIIKYSTFGDPRWFIDCPSTPLTVAEKNGEKIKSATLFEKCEKFPNPGPVVMFAQYNLFAIIQADDSCLRTKTDQHSITSHTSRQAAKKL